VYSRIEGKIFQDKIHACSILLSVDALIYFKFKLHLEFRSKKLLFYDLIRFRFTLIQIIKLKLRERTHHWTLSPSPLLKPLKQRLNDDFEIALFRSVLFKRNNYFSSVFTNRLDRRMYETKFPTHVSFIYLFFPPFAICRFAVTCPPTLKTFVSFMTVSVLTRYTSILLTAGIER